MKRALFLVVVTLLVAHAAPAQVTLWLPVAASNPGLFGTQWTTDLWVFTPVVDSPIEVAVAFFPDASGSASPQEVTIEVPAASVRMVEDVVGTLFGESRPGALRFRSEHPFRVQSRTSNDGGTGGTYGQGIAAFDPSETPTGWVLVGAANVPGEGGVRSNIGFVNTTASEEDGLLMLFDEATGEVLATTRATIGGLGWMQTDAFQLFGLGDAQVEHAMVFGLFAPGVQSYLSRVDNRSGDGTFVLPFDARSVYTVPTDWEVDFTLSWTNGVTMDSITYSGPDGSDVVVSSPAASPFTVTLSFTSPAQFCYSAVGSAASGGGSITAVTLTTRGGDPPAEHRSISGVADEGPIAMEDCIDLY
jgi:hypothetical protein